MQNRLEQTPGAGAPAITPPDAPAPGVSPGETTNGNGAESAEHIDPATQVRPLSAEETRAAVGAGSAADQGAPAGSAPAANPFAGVKDSLGREFTPTAFRIKNGVPQVDTKGRFVPIGLGRKPAGSASTIADAPAAALPPAPPPPPPAPDEYHLAAQAAVRALYAMGMLLGGDEWMPTDEEHVNLINATEAYFRFKQFRDVPPGLALAIAVAGYAAPRFSKPKTLSRLARFKQWWASRQINRRATAVAERAGALS